MNLIERLRTRRATEDMCELAADEIEHQRKRAERKEAIIERLEGVLREMYSAENYEQLCEMLDEALDKECRHGEAGDCYACAASEQATDKEQT